MKMYKDVNVDPTTEEAVVNLFASLFNDMSRMVPVDIRHNLECLSEGGFSVEDRTFKKSTVNYLVSRFSLIFVGVLANKEFRTAFVDAIAMEQNLDDQTPEKQAEIRADMNSIKLKNTDNNATITIDFSKFNDSVYRSLNKQLGKSLTKIDGYDDAIDEIIEHLSVDDKDVIGFIISNFAYLLRAFEKDVVFFAYVTSVLKSVQNSMALEY